MPYIKLSALKLPLPRTPSRQGRGKLPPDLFKLKAGGHRRLRLRTKERILIEVNLFIIFILLYY
jgi:hypothetical protein